MTSQNDFALRPATAPRTWSRSRSRLPSPADHDSSGAHPDHGEARPSAPRPPVPIPPTPSRSCPTGSTRCGLYTRIPPPDTWPSRPRQGTQDTPGASGQRSWIDNPSATTSPCPHVAATRRRDQTATRHPTTPDESPVVCQQALRCCDDHPKVLRRPRESIMLRALSWQRRYCRFRG